jgi:hypothetical protein
MEVNEINNLVRRRNNFFIFPLQGLYQGERERFYIKANVICEFTKNTFWKYIIAVHIPTLVNFKAIIISAYIS